jgi:hypothetical protein
VQAGSNESVSLQSTLAGYSPHEHRPLTEYAGLTGIFLAVYGGSLVALRRSGEKLPERLDVRDLVLLGVATHKLSRLLAKDKVTSFLRAPFTRFQESSGQGEVSEQPRGEGLQLAVGELLVCPYCLAQWVAAGLSLSLIAAPQATRLIASVYTTQTLADFLQLAYLAAEERA